MSDLKEHVADVAVAEACEPCFLRFRDKGDNISLEYIYYRPIIQIGVIYGCLVSTSIGVNGLVVVKSPSAYIIMIKT